MTLSSEELKTLNALLASVETEDFLKLDKITQFVHSNVKSLRFNVLSHLDGEDYSQREISYWDVEVIESSVESNSFYVKHNDDVFDRNKKEASMGEIRRSESEKVRKRYQMPLDVAAKLAKEISALIRINGLTAEGYIHFTDARNLIDAQIAQGVVYATDVEWKAAQYEFVKQVSKDSNDKSAVKRALLELNAAKSLEDNK
jgi:hypothetical protein